MKLKLEKQQAKEAMQFMSVVVAVFTLVMIVDANFINEAWAAKGRDPFDSATTKGGELVDILKGKIAITITAIVISITAILMLMSRVSHLVGVRIMAGAFILGSAAGLAEWLYS